MTIRLGGVSVYLPCCEGTTKGCSAIYSSTAALVVTDFSLSLWCLGWTQGFG